MKVKDYLDPPHKHNCGMIARIRTDFIKHRLWRVSKNSIGKKEACCHRKGTAARQTRTRSFNPNLYKLRTHLQTFFFRASISRPGEMIYSLVITGRSSENHLAASPLRCRKDWCVGLRCRRRATSPWSASNDVPIGVIGTRACKSRTRWWTR